MHNKRLGGSYGKDAKFFGWVVGSLGCQWGLRFFHYYMFFHERRLGGFLLGVGTLDFFL
jgi:hypothetical protein